MCTKQKNKLNSQKLKKKLNEKEISNLLDEEFKVPTIKFLTKLRRLNEHSENVNEEMENKRKSKKIKTEHTGLPWWHSG